MLFRSSPFRIAFFKDHHWVPEVTSALDGSETPQTFAVTMRTVDNYLSGTKRLPLRTKIDSMYKEFRTDEGKDEFTSVLRKMLSESLE